MFIIAVSMAQANPLVQYERSAMAGLSKCVSDHMKSGVATEVAYAFQACRDWEADVALHLAALDLMELADGRPTKLVSDGERFLLIEAEVSAQVVKS